MTLFTSLTSFSKASIIEIIQKSEWFNYPKSFAKEDTDMPTKKKAPAKKKAAKKAVKKVVKKVKKAVKKVVKKKTAAKKKK